MFQLTDDALSQMISLVEDEHHVVDVNKSFNIENEINNYRNQLKNQNVLDVNNKEYDYQMGCTIWILLENVKTGRLCSKCGGSQ